MAGGIICRVLEQEIAPLCGGGWRTRRHSVAGTFADSVYRAEMPAVFYRCNTCNHEWDTLADALAIDEKDPVLHSAIRPDWEG